jgi:uncharacterized protein
MFDSRQTLEVTDHRPWPLPQRPWIMTQTWSELLFLHYPVAQEEVRPLVPSALSLDTLDGKAWVSIAAFRLSGLRLRWLPPLPFGSRFLEINVRTYVTVGGKPGVFFFSLDASSRLAVWGARTAYALPYDRAVMEMRTIGEEVKYRSRRQSPVSAEFEATYRPTGVVRHATSGNLDYFLTERYCLYAVRGRNVCRTDIHHLPWPLQATEAEIARNTMLNSAGLSGSQLLADASRFVRKLDVVVWAPERC